MTRRVEPTSPICRPVSPMPVAKHMNGNPAVFRCGRNVCSSCTVRPDSPGSVPALWSGCRPSKEAVQVAACDIQCLMQHMTTAAKYTLNHGIVHSFRENQTPEVNTPASAAASFRSKLTILLTSSSKATVVDQFRSSFALVASPMSSSTSVGRK